MRSKNATDGRLRESTPIDRELRILEWGYNRKSERLFVSYDLLKLGHQKYSYFKSKTYLADFICNIRVSRSYILSLII